MDTGSDGRISVTLAKVVEGFGLEVVREYGDLEAIHLSTPDINRPGLQMAGFFDYFGADRIQIVGKSELEYICRFPARTRSKRLGRFCASGIPCILLTRSLPLIEEMDRAAERHGIPIFRTTEDTSVFLGMIITWLNVQLAPRISTHGCFIEVYGEGILILGESGVGKSETVLELVKRGHRLVADDVVEIRKVSNQTLIGTAPDVIRHFIEIRGLGIIDVKNLFGMGAIKQTERIDLVIQLEIWDNRKAYERIGLEDEFTEILDSKLPIIRIPVKPGRNLAIIIESAAMNNRQKKMGYNAAKALTDRVMGLMDGNGG